MTELSNSADAVVIGGGFYGAAIAIYLTSVRKFNRVILIERESSLLQRASFNNQARVHNGYHYPRSFRTAYRSRINFPRFVQNWKQIVKKDFAKLYAISRHSSKVSALQFFRFCNEIGANIKVANQSIKRLFEPRLIEEVFLVEEFAFDATRLADWAVNELKKAGVQIRYMTRAVEISRSGVDDRLIVLTRSNSGAEIPVSCQYVFNCTYSGLNQFAGDFPGTHRELKQEIAEMALVKVPPIIRDIGITVMDGPFFSMMPFPARDLHTLSHVRYTPHYSWKDRRGCDPYEQLCMFNISTRFDRMRRDAGRYMPILLQAKYLDSLFEVKTVLAKSEGDDSRPILFEKYTDLPGCYSILGGKIDNIYDIIEKLETENFNTLVKL